MAFAEHRGQLYLLEGRMAFEYGVTDNLKLALYVTYDWTGGHHNGPNGATTPPEPFSYDLPDPDAYYRATRFVGIPLRESTVC